MRPSPERDPHALLYLAADFLDDIERLKIATENRVRALDQIKGQMVSPMAIEFEAQLARVREIEKDAIKMVEKRMREHPLGPFVKRTVGLGDKQAGRLLAAVGDPYLRPVFDEDGAIIGERPRRGPAELWAYCGLHVVDGKRPRFTRGQQGDWNATAKKRAYLCAASCIKQMHSPYRAVYDRERAKWADRDTTDLHKHNHALSVVAKEILKDLWIEARDLHHAGADDLPIAA